MTNPILMRVIVMLAGAVAEIMKDDEYAREAEMVLESVVAEFERLDGDARRELLACVDTLAREADGDPTRTDWYRTFLAGFPAAFGLIDERPC